MIRSSHFHKTVDVKAWTHVDAVQKTITPLGGMGLLVGFIALLGYCINVESFYRPLTAGAATNPITAILFILLGYSLISSKTYQKSKLISASLVVFIAGIRLVSFAFQSDAYLNLMPFQSVVSSEQSIGKSNEFSVNSALMFFLLGCSVLTYYLKAFRLSQIIAFITITIPLVSIVGYAYRIDKAYSHMSLHTASFGLMLTIAAIFLTADKLLMSGILSPYRGGKIARVLIVLSSIFSLFVGYLILKTLFETGEGNWFGVFTVAVSWFIFMIIGTSAYYQEIIDKEHRNRESQLTIAALSDSLTGLPNRRMFFDYCNREFDRIKRSDDEIFLLVIDVDDFKNINDTAGHQAGDLVLQQIGYALQKSVRSVDIAARVGGEEFGILLTNTNQEGAIRVVEEIQKNIENIDLDGMLDSSAKVTVSIGGASSAHFSCLDTAFKGADKAMYVSKRNGKNQFTLSPILDDTLSEL